MYWLCAIGTRWINDIVCPFHIVHQKIKEYVDKYLDVTVMVNFESFHSVYSSVMENLEYPSIKALTLLRKVFLNHKHDISIRWIIIKGLELLVRNYVYDEEIKKIFDVDCRCSQLE